jgi:hypothetical protein
VTLVTEAQWKKKSDETETVQWEAALEIESPAQEAS